jgi:hypothetical protein
MHDDGSRHFLSVAHEAEEKEGWHNKGARPPLCLTGPAF